MKKKITLGCILMATLMLSGCSVTDTIVEKRDDLIRYLSGIEEDTEYQDYQALKQDGKLNENGEYRDTEIEAYLLEADTQEKQVWVTFAQNEFLKIHYYLDSSLTQEIEGTSVYLDPGEKIYCSQPTVENEYSNSYVFQEFQIYEFDENGAKSNLYGTAGDQSLILEIPENYEGTELAIFPVGQYEKKGLQLEAYYVNENGSKQTVTGTWYVNGEPYHADTDQVGATDDYTVKFEFDKDTYYYVAATPEPFSATDGTVEFKTSSALNSTESYAIELHQWITANFDGETDKIKSINGDEDWDKGQESYSNLKGGDTLTIVTEDGYRIFSNEIEIGSPEDKDDGYQYTIVIPSDEYRTEYSFIVTKTELTVSLESSVGTNIGFNIIASGYNKTKYYDKQTLNRDDKLDPISIGLENNITISIVDGSLSADQAIKLTINKTDGNNEKTKEIKYISETGGSAEITLYDGEVKNPSKIYQTVDIEISLVDVMEVKIPEIDNGTIKLVLNDCTESEELENGSIVEGSRKATVTISPKSGYYVSGKNTKENGSSYQYEKSMKLSDYEDDISDIIQNHEIRKLYSITLDTDDPYGTVTFKRNGDIVTGTIKVREEDTLTLEYELTASGYEIVRESDGVLSSINNWRKNVFSSNKETTEIPLSEDLDGKTLKRETYIKVLPK
jgi:hypothetical protein